MIGLMLTIAAFVGSLYGSFRSVGWGFAVVMAVGYFYGILRAQFPDGFSHFMFDGAVLGMYIGHLARVGKVCPPRAPELFQWTTCLIIWPVVVFGLGGLYPQHLLIQLVGLRAAIWFLPILLIGASVRREDMCMIALALAVLNLVALVFALAEYLLGVEAFFPRNAVTELIYRSRDIANFSAYRIPATFSTSAAYGGTMVASLPWLIGRWLSEGVGFREKLLMIGSTLAAAIGVFLCGSRTAVLLLVALGLTLAYQFRGRLGTLVPILLVGGVVAYVVTNNERFQRFASLQDYEMVAGRLGGSVNVSAFNIVIESPLGNGLGSAFGTSIPSFLAELAPPLIGAENEFARIGIEQTLVGLVLWFTFLAWLFTKRGVPPCAGWQSGGVLIWLFVLMTWSTALLGCGTLTAIPGTPMLLFLMGVLGRTSFRPSSSAGIRPLGQP